MATKIEWLHAPGFQGETWNPVTGCTKVSAGCKHCWAEGQFPRSYKRHGRAFTDVQFHPERLSQPLRWRKPRMIAVSLMGDLFHDRVTNEQIAAVFGVMAACPQHRFVILTKRAARLPKWFREIMGEPQFLSRMIAHAKTNGVDIGGIVANWPLPNVWLGVSIENQATADERIPLLLQTPAAVRFLSIEPMIGPIVLDHCEECGGHGQGRHGSGYPDGYDDERECGPSGMFPPIDWVIVGGESGQKARDMDPRGPRSIRGQCKAAGVPFFFKQMARKAPIPDDLMIREFPK